MNHAPISLHVGEQWISEGLAEPTSAGYLWSILSPGPWLAVRLERPAMPTEANVVVGGECTVHLVVEALAPGVGTLEARCAHPWDASDSTDLTRYAQPIVVR